MKHRRKSRRAPSAVSGELLEVRSLLSSTGYAAMDGWGNNSSNPDWGTPDTELLRMARPEYADGKESPAGTSRESARMISNEIAAQTGSTPNARGMSDFVWLWGQFLDHDIDLSDGTSPPEAFDIEVPQGDPWFDPAGTGTVTLPLNRSIHHGPDDSSTGQREQLNQITSYIDGSMVYGSDQHRADALRTFTGGKLRTGANDLLPWNTDGLENGGGTGSNLFLAGDIRANENVGLTAMHTLFVREHNRLTDELAASDPTLDDEELYQQARCHVRALIQSITYNEFLPALMGADAPDAHGKYDASIKAQIANEFSTAAFRLGHTLLSPTLLRLDAAGAEIPEGHLPLRDAFFNPQKLVESGPDPLFRGAAEQAAQELDNQIIDDVRNFLFGMPGSGGLDLASLNIQRGRDHGLADYNAVRRAVTEQSAWTWSDITSDVSLAAKLEAVYGSLQDIDLWVGGLAEDHRPGSSLGPTFTAILQKQFSWLRDGDSYWYSRTLSASEVEQVEATTLSDIIMRNTDVTDLQQNVFFVPGSEVPVIRLADFGEDRIQIRVIGNTLYVQSQDDGTVFFSRALNELAGLHIIGNADIGERIYLTGEFPDGALPAGIQITGSHQCGHDILIVRGSAADDHIVVDGNQLRLNDLDVVWSDFDTLILQGVGGDDTIEVIESPARQTILRGGDGHDVLRGGAGAEFLYGENGDDRLFGGGGNDILNGGNGHDQLFGNDGWDQLIDSDGWNLWAPDGAEDSPENLRKLAWYLDGRFGFDDTQTDYWTNWGNCGEKWLQSRHGWFFIMPDGKVYQWDRRGRATGRLVAELSPLYHSEIHRLQTAFPSP